MSDANEQPRCAQCEQPQFADIHLRSIVPGWHEFVATAEALKVERCGTILMVRVPPQPYEKPMGTCSLEKGHGGEHVFGCDLPSETTTNAPATSPAVEPAADSWARSFDARDWVRAWMSIIKEHPEIPTDEGTMLGWFANAIMAGFDHRAQNPPAPSPDAQIKHCCEICGEAQENRDLGRVCTSCINSVQATRLTAQPADTPEEDEDCTTCGRPASDHYCYDPDFDTSTYARRKGGK